MARHDVYNERLEYKANNAKKEPSPNSSGPLLVIDNPSLSREDALNNARRILSSYSDTFRASPESKPVRAKAVTQISVENMSKIATTESVKALIERIRELKPALEDYHITEILSELGLNVAILRGVIEEDFKKVYENPESGLTPSSNSRGGKPASTTSRTLPRTARVAHPSDTGNLTVRSSTVSYQEVSRLYDLVMMLQSYIIETNASVMEDRESGAAYDPDYEAPPVFREGVTMRDIASFTNAVNNLYSTFIRSRDTVKLLADIQNITMAVKEALKGVPLDVANRFIEVLNRYDN